MSIPVSRSVILHNMYGIIRAGFTYNGLENRKNIGTKYTAL